MLLFFRYDFKDLDFFCWALVIELAIFWRYVEIYDDIIVCCLLSLFGITFFILIIGEIAPIYNSITPYDWLHLSGPYHPSQTELKTMSHVAFEAAVFSILFTIWTLLPFVLKRIWEFHFAK